MKYLLVNFGGPRNLEEIPSFLKELLTDPDVIRSKFPLWLHRRIFSRVAKKRAPKITPDYVQIGGKSPIYEDTEELAKQLSGKLGDEVLTFHRYLSATHPEFFQKIKQISAREIRIFPMFPQFSYATTGSIARFFSRHLPEKLVHKMRWVKSYPSHPLYIAAFTKIIQNFLAKHALKEEETILLFSAHGLPISFIETGEVYQKECEDTFRHLKNSFPHCLSRLSYQSKFGPGEWLKPYTDRVCEDILLWHEDRKNVVFIPLSFTSDHIETLFEIEHLYLPIIKKNGLQSFRCPALNLDKNWISSIARIVVEETSPCSNQMLTFSS